MNVDDPVLSSRKRIVIWHKNQTVRRDQFHHIFAFPISIELVKSFWASIWHK